MLIKSLWPSFLKVKLLKWLIVFSWITSTVIEPRHVVMALFVFCQLIVQSRMRSNLVGRDVWFLVRPFDHFHTSCGISEGSDETVQMGRLVWAFAGRLCSKYYNLMRWLISQLYNLCCFASLSSSVCTVIMFLQRWQSDGSSGSVKVNRGWSV